MSIPVVQNIIDRVIPRKRSRVMAQLAQAQQRCDARPQDTQARFQLAQSCFEAGDFERARELLAPLDVESSSRVLWLAAHLAYLGGDYAGAEDYLRGLRHFDKIKADLGLTFVYYQTNQYEKAAELFKGLEGKIKLPHWDLMKSFGEAPYQIEWGSSFSQVPFLLSEPLPLIAVEINDKPLYAIIDTGADSFLLDDRLAASLGIHPVARSTEAFAGGKSAQVGYARAQSLKLGEVTMRHVPLMLGSVERFSVLTEGAYPIHGVLGTSVLRQFLATMDYPRACLCLRPRTPVGQQDLAETLQGRQVTHVPFALAQTHFMIARGRLDEAQGLSFFVDSGLAVERASVATHPYTLEFAHISIPPTEKLPEALGGLGGGGFAVGRFPVSKLGLGALCQENQEGVHGVFPSQLYWGCEFIIDGLISHNFLKRYSWSIDFSAMQMLFAA